MRYLPALVVDVVLVLVFAVIGRASHEEDPAGFLLTAWPFLVALLVGHALAALLPGRPRRPWSPAWGAVVWIVTVAGGMLLRLVSGDTAQLAFIIVATLTLAVFLLGWRVATALLRRRRAGARDAEPGERDAEPVAPAATADAAAPDSEPADAAAPDPEPADAAASGPEPADAAASDPEPAELGDLADPDRTRP